MVSCLIDCAVLAMWIEVKFQYFILKFVYVRWVIPLIALILWKVDIKHNDFKIVGLKNEHQLFYYPNYAHVNFS